METPLQLYTRILESAENNSVTIISLGFLTNLATLLESSNRLSLIKSKVRKLVVMNGTYPGPGWAFNFGQLRCNRSCSEAMVPQCTHHIHRLRAGDQYSVWK